MNYRYDAKSWHFSGTADKNTTRILNNMKIGIIKLNVNRFPNFFDGVNIRRQFAVTIRPASAHAYRYHFIVVRDEYVTFVHVFIEYNFSDNTLNSL